MGITACADVLIVEDHPLYGDGLVHLLATHAPGLLCRVAGDGSSALALLAREGGVDLMLVDHHLPGAMDGLALLECAGRLHPTAGRVLMSGHDDARLAQQARALGAMGFLAKSQPPAVWIAALGSVLSGEPWFAAVPAARTAGLTVRQAAILERIAAGQTSRFIARELGITERTIKYHLSEVYLRLGAASRAEAVARATSLGWIGVPKAAGRRAPSRR